MKKLLILVAASSMFLTACGASICERFENSGDKFEDKFSACSSGEGTTTTTTEFNRAQCDENLSNCTAQDEEKLNNYFDCIEKLDACVAGQEEAFTSAFIACAANVGQLSTPCLEGFSSSGQ